MILSEPLIETEPIQITHEMIGFQSKFFDWRINQQEIIGSIEKAKTKNPELDKIYFYINQEFSESSKKDKKEPQYKIEIETFAKSKGLEIEWKVPSHIEAQLSLDSNQALAQYFFSLEKGVIDFIVELNNHASAILKPIHSEIEFNGAKIKIDRSGLLAQLKTILVKSPLVILSGVGGVGKTALVKDFQDFIGDNIPLFIFKAAEFNISHVNKLFSSYGSFTLLDFVKEYEGVDEKYIVIDSAEKLADLQNQEPFQEFLSILLEHNWKIIFTTRYSYLDDLKFQFVEIYRLSFQVLDIENLSLRDLEKLSKTYNFSLPEDERLLELLKNPFYLNEYLHNHKTIPEPANVSDFKNILWDKQITRSSYRVNNAHIRRERCFLDIAKRRADSGGFFIDTGDYAEDILQSLEADEIIKRDSKTKGYFITHDIYEEWALDKFIERAFYNLVSYTDFFGALGSSLSIRRAFRNWLSEKLSNNRDEIKPLIEESFVSEKIDNFWKDEILVSVLLSDYSEAFFQMFERTLLEDNQKNLMRAIFLLRIACKEIDEGFLNLLGLSKKDGISLKTIFTRPKGKGWNCVIGFLYKHKEEISLSNARIITPLLEDWNNKTKEGITTRRASLIALYYYEEINKRGGFGYSSRDERERQLIGIILNGSSEIKKELNTIFDKVLSIREKDHRSKYYEIIRTVLSSALSSLEIARSLPEQVIRLADLFWFRDPNEKSDEEYRYSRMPDVEDHFCISSGSLEYYPASAFQTPIFQLLKFAPKATIDFVLSFTNRAVDCYAKSKFGREAEEVEVFINEDEIIHQYISVRLWDMYRGTQSSTHLLESIHMALERWLLEYAKTALQVELENVCNYLIKNSKSASITAVVASVVLAQPSKLFNIAKILFQTKEFFFYDTGRALSDRTAKSLIGYGYNYRNEIYVDERMKTCDDPHRQASLESLAFNYQLFKAAEEETDEVFDKRQSILWAIFDNHYANLPPKTEETEADKTWRLYLARMDRRKMNTEMQQKDGQVLITFNSEVEPELKQFSEDSIKASTAAMKYTSLYLWSQIRFRREIDKYEQYRKYEDDIQLAISETKEVVDQFKQATGNSHSLFNASIPAYTCAVLIRDFFDRLSEEEKNFCKEVIVEFASIPLALKDYHYQISDGIKPAIISLPSLIKHFPEEKDQIKSLLFLLLLDDHQSDTSESTIRAILYSLWEVNFEDAQSIFLGYLLLKPKYEELWDEMWKEHFQSFQNSEMSRDDVLRRFLELYENDLEDMVSNRINAENLGDLEPLALEVLNTAFELLPLKTANKVHKEFVTVISRKFSKELLKRDDDKVDFNLKRRFLDKFAYFVLSSTRNDIELYLKPFVDNFNDSEYIADFFQEFISAEDSLNHYEEFWMVWSIFYPKMVEISRRRGYYHYTEKIIHNYLLAWSYWRKGAKEWHTLKEREKLFFKKVAQDMGHHPSVLDSLSQFLNEIGRGFYEDGVFWISDILQKNDSLFSEELEINTVYYLENLIRKYVLTNRRKIKVSMQIKTQITVILNFLVERGSVTGYLLREDVL